MKKIITSIGHAAHGIAIVWKSQRNFKIHSVFVICLVGALLVFNVTYIETALIVLAMAIVLTAEMINTAIEETWDELEPQHHPVVLRVKDTMAGAVLLSAIGAGVVGILVFAHHFFPFSL